MSTGITGIARVTVHDDATPSAHYPADEQERNGAVDISVTIEINVPTRDALMNVGQREIDRALGDHYDRDELIGDMSAPEVGRRLWARECAAKVLGSRTIEGSITLYRDDANGGELGTCGTPLDGWCSGEIVAWLYTLSDRSRRAVCASLASGHGTEDVEIEQRST